MKLGKSGITIAEVVVVVVILAILSTMGLVSYSKYIQTSRDSARKSDVTNIEKILGLFRIHAGVYPDPDSAFDVVYSGYPIWKQGIFGAGAQAQTGKIFGTLQDPKYKNFYSYSVTPSKTEYQLGVVYEREDIGESDDEYAFSVIPEVHADTNPIVNYDPTSLPGMQFWYSGKDVDADDIDDTIDTSIPNIGVVNNVTATNFTPFYFDRVVWLDAQDINGDGSSGVDNQDVLSWKNKTGAGFNGFVPQSGNNHSNPAYSSPPSYSATGFDGKPGVYFDGVSKGDRISVDRGAQAKGNGFSLAYTFKINDAGGNSAENVGTNHACIISVGPTGGGQYYTLPGGWQLSRDGRKNNFVFRINGAITNRIYFNGVDCLDDNGNVSCGNSGGNAEVAFGDWSEVNDNEVHTVFVTYEGNTVTGYLDGTKRFEAVMSENTEPFGEYFRFYGNRAGTSYLEGMLGEVFIANDRTSLQDLEKIEGYFARRWDWLEDLPVAHPYKTDTPEMDAFSQLEYTRFAGDGVPMNSYSAADFFATNPQILNSKTVRFPGSMPDMNIEEDYKTHMWRGPIKVSETGNYKFYTTSDDFSFISIDGNIVVDNGGSHSPEYAEGTIYLEKDTLYNFEFIYGELSGPAYLDYGVTGPGVVGYRKYEGFSWRDKSGLGNHAIQAIPEIQPSFDFASRAFKFERDTYFDFTTQPFSGSDDIEFFVVWEVDEVGNGELEGEVFENSTTGGTGLRFGVNGMKSGNTLNNGTSVLGKQYELSSYRLDQSGSLQKYYIGGQNYHQGVSDISSLGSSLQYLGGKEDGFSGRIKEIIAYNSKVVDSDRIEIEGYLSHTWNIAHKLPFDHPYYEPLDTGEQIYVSLSGNYNGLFTHGKLGNSHVVVAAPSIMGTTSASGSLDVSSLYGENRFVYDLKRNVPASYTDTLTDSEKLGSKNGFFFPLSNPLLFQGTREKLANYDGISQIDKKIRVFYGNVDFYKDISGYLDTGNSDYVKNILGNVVGINPITPYYCKDILEKGFGSNISPLATLEGSSGLDVSSGIGTLNDEVTQTNGDYSYRTNPDETTHITFNWSTPQDVGLIKVFNTFGDISGNLWAAKLQLFNGSDTLVYEYVFGDTFGVPEIRIFMPDSGVLQGITRMRIIPSPDYPEIALREVSIFSGPSRESGVYLVDSDGIGGKEAYKVYCDMQTVGGGWTKIGDNFVDRSTFDGLKEPSSFAGYLVAGNRNNISENSLRSDIVPPSVLPDANILRHSGDADSYFELRYDDIPDVEFTSEIRLGAWIRGSNKSPFNYTLQYEGASAESIHSSPPPGASSSVWRYETIRIPLTDTLEDFRWHIGKGIDASGSPIDITGLSFELYYR